jgi:hypothetical protein
LKGNRLTTNNKNQLPTLSDDLITFLDDVYPHECIRPGETMEDAQRRAGCRELIDELIHWREATNESRPVKVADKAEDAFDDGPGFSFLPRDDD